MLPLFLSLFWMKTEESDGSQRETEGEVKIKARNMTLCHHGKELILSLCVCVCVCVYGLNKTARGERQVNACVCWEVDNVSQRFFFLFFFSFFFSDSKFAMSERLV